MIYVAVLLGIAVAVTGFVIIERRRAAGTLTYPLWQGNMLLLWAVLALVFTLLVGALNLPRYIGIVLHGTPIVALVTEVSHQEHCKVTYLYKVEGVEHTASDSHCGVVAGQKMPVFYDAQAPDNSTLYPPKIALKNELIAMALICLCLPALLVLWLRATHVIGARKSS